MRAYLSLVSTDDFLPGAVVMFNSLRSSKQKYPCFLLVTRSVSERSVRIAESHGLHVIRDDDVLPIKVGGASHRWDFTFDKLKVFRLKQFSKVIFLDSDMWINGNLDHLFDLPGFSAVESRAPSPFLGGRKYFNSGLMVIEPDASIFESLIRLAPEVVARYQEANLPFGDQNILNHYCVDWPSRNLRIPDEYNVFWGSIEDYIRQGGYSVGAVPGRTQIKVVHFTGRRKPWLMPARFALLSVLRPLKNLGRLPSRDGISVMWRYFGLLCSYRQHLSQIAA